MPRKKIIKNGFHLKYIPCGRLDDLKALAKKFQLITDEHIALCKYIEAFSSIVERCWNSDSEYVPVSVKVLSGKLGIKPAAGTKILNDLVHDDFLIRDKSHFVLGEHSWEYKPIYSVLDSVAMSKKCMNKKTDMMMYGWNDNTLIGDLKLYYDVLCKIKMSYDVYNYMNILISNDNTYDKHCLLNIKGIYDDSSVPSKGLTNDKYDSSVPYNVIGKIPTEFIPVFKLLGGKYRVSRPIARSRVYTNITNLAREYRPFLRLNGKPLIGFDIANSQPLIAAIAFRKYSEKKYECIKDDVLEYQQACEAGIFYEYFMELNGIDCTDEKNRTEFKGLFFGKVFYTKEVEKENYLKTQFIKKYPTCHEAILRIKGGLYSKEYKDFPALMTEIETFIMFNANVELIKQGYDVVNIFDSLYSDSEETITIAKQLVIKKFSDFNITPKLKDISYLRQNHSPALQLLEKKIEHNYSLKEINVREKAPAVSQYIEHILSDGYIIYNLEYFSKKLDVPAENINECYQSQFKVGTFFAKNAAEYKAAIIRQEEINALLNQNADTSLKEGLLINEYLK